ncbi:MAG: hypothetical protein LBH06_00775 [Rikenellaceae bacterium]|jgi:hypothetical protein|nr:hypothetical protein [Rikenellaceae bacterium]
MLDDDEKGVRKTDSLGGRQEMLFVTESGLYALIMRSRKSEAKAFRKWVTTEVLLSIRKYGSYVNPQTQLAAEDYTRDAIMGYVMSANLYEHDVAAVFKKYNLTFGRLFLIMSGVERNEAVMYELQERALANKKKYPNAYYSDRVREVIGELTNY